MKALPPFLDFRERAHACIFSCLFTKFHFSQNKTVFVVKNNSYAEMIHLEIF